MKIKNECEVAPDGKEAKCNKEMKFLMMPEYNDLKDTMIFFRKI